MCQQQADNFEDVGHEPTTVSARAISLAIAVLFGSICVALVLMGALLMYLAAARGGVPTIAPIGTPVAPPPGLPAVDIDQAGTLRELRSREISLLSEYAWVDRDAGVARIPIGRAMKILAQQPTPSPELPNGEPAVP
ncbi:MAG: hypothetical protein WD738_15035 [Pirellulales bacterium]